MNQVIRLQNARPDGSSRHRSDRGGDRRRSGGRAPARRVAVLVGAGGLLATGLTACLPIVTFTVNTTVDARDAAPGDGVCARVGNPAQCTIRAAIDEANATPSASVHVLVPTGTYTVTRAGVDDVNDRGDFDVDLQRVVEVRGTGAAVVIQGGGSDRVFDSRGQLTLDNVTVQSGITAADGGAVRLAGQGGVISNATIAGSSAAGRGGGVAVLAGRLDLHASAVVGNTAGIEGGGIHVAGGAALDAARSTLSDNEVNPVGLGVDLPLAAPADTTVLSTVEVPAVPGAGSAPVPAPAGPDGTLPVIVQFEAPLVPEHQLDGPAAADQRSMLTDLGDDVVASLPGGEARVRTRYLTVPMIATSLRPDEIAAVRAQPGIVSVQRDELSAPALDTSVAFIGGDQAQAVGADGAGAVVAVLDTGVDNDHVMLDGGKVVAEACRAQGATFGDAPGDCPNGLPSQDGAESGENCARLDLGCWHGTHVASTAAGHLVNDGTHDYAGVAPAADIMAVQVFSRLVGAASCSGAAECVRSYTSDQVAGLDYVYSQRAAFPIAAVNMSLGGGSFAAACDGDSRKPVIDNLRAAGIVTVISSGNSSLTGAVGAPGCISTAFTVGAVGNASDDVAPFSNTSASVDVFAPGVDISAAYPGNALTNASGTSMAAPHVAGALAALRSGFPAATATQLEDALRTTGTPVTDLTSAPVITRPRIDVMAALASLGGPGRGGGISVAVGGTASLTSLTVAFNTAAWGGGVHSAGQTSVLGSIVSNATDGLDCATSSGTITSLGGNLDSDASCGFLAANDRSDAEPLLGALGLNGGTTPNHRPAVGSPAIDVIPIGTLPCVPEIPADQRGVARPQGAACDIGSVER